jgi:hypothetical protein
MVLGEKCFPKPMPDLEKAKPRSYCEACSRLEEMLIERRKVVLLLVFAISFGVSAFGQSKPAYPVKASSNGRYLVDQNGNPFLMVGDSPQTPISVINATDTGLYFANRQSKGYNTVWMMFPCTNATIPICPTTAAALDGTVPFTSGTSPSSYDLSTPNNAYWAEVDAAINLAAQYNLLVLFNVIETAGWTVAMENNGNTKTYNFGQYIGSRYKNFPNIVWLVGNDFQTWNTNSVDNTLAQSLMQGILSADSNHLMLTELNYYLSGSHDDSLLAPYTTLDGAYTYYPTYYEVLKQYNAVAMPVVTEEAYWWGITYGNITPTTATPLMLRKQAYWTVLSGGLGGYLSGDINSAAFQSGWQTAINDIPATHMSYWGQFFESLSFYKLVPDQSHTVVTAGYGTATGNGSGNIQTDNYVTTALASDNSSVLSYCPQSCTITANMAALSGAVKAQWYDPTNNTYQAISGSPFTNSGTHTFSTPGNNSAGDPDWVLLLQVSSLLVPPTGLTATVSPATQ